MAEHANMAKRESFPHYDIFTMSEGRETSIYTQQRSSVNVISQPTTVANLVGIHQSVYGRVARLRLAGLPPRRALSWCSLATEGDDDRNG